MLIATVSSKGSPGASVSALALALTWPRPVILVELDPRGGDVLLGYGRGQNIGPAGLLRLQVATRTSKPVPSLLWNEVVELPTASDGGGKWWMPGLADPQQANSLNWSAIARALRAVEGDVDVIADCGSATGDRERLPRAVWAAADMVALAVRPTLNGVHIAQSAAGLLRTDLMAGGFGADRLASFVVDARHGYPVGEVAREMAGCAPMLDRKLPYDPAAADVLTGGQDQTRRFLRSPLMRAAAVLADQIGGRAIELGATVAAPTRIPDPATATDSTVPASLSLAGEPGSWREPAEAPLISVVPVIAAATEVPDRGTVRQVLRRPIPVPRDPGAEARREEQTR